METHLQQPSHPPKKKMTKIPSKSQRPPVDSQRFVSPWDSSFQWCDSQVPSSARLKCCRPVAWGAYLPLQRHGTPVQELMRSTWYVYFGDDEAPLFLSLLFMQTSRTRYINRQASRSFAFFCILVIRGFTWLYPVACRIQFHQLQTILPGGQPALIRS